MQKITERINQMGTREILKELRKTYPEVVSTTQMMKICHIGKKHVAYLMQNNIIPHEDTGKKTRRYKIQLVDVARYLVYRPVFPKGIFSRRRKRHPVATLDKSPGYMKKMRSHYEELFADREDIMGVNEVGEILERDRKLVVRYINNRDLKAVLCNRRYCISKEALIDFLMGDYFRTSTSKEFEGIFKETLLK